MNSHVFLIFSASLNRRTTPILPTMVDSIELAASELLSIQEIRDPKTATNKLSHRKGALTKLMDAFKMIQSVSFFKAQIPKLEGILTKDTKAILQYEAIHIQHAILTGGTDEPFECALSVHEREESHQDFMDTIANHLELACIARECKSLQLKSTSFDGIMNLKAVLPQLSDLQETISKLEYRFEGADPPTDDSSGLEERVNSLGLKIQTKTATAMSQEATSASSPTITTASDPSVDSPISPPSSAKPKLKFKPPFFFQAKSWIGLTFLLCLRLTSSNLDISKTVKELLLCSRQ